MFPRLLVNVDGFRVGVMRCSRRLPPPPVDVAKLTISAPVDDSRPRRQGACGAFRRAWPGPPTIRGSMSGSARSTAGRTRPSRHLLIDVQANGSSPFRTSRLAGALLEPQGGAWHRPPFRSWRIKIDTREELVRTTNVPREGNIGHGDGDPAAGVDEVAARARPSRARRRMFQVQAERPTCRRGGQRPGRPGPHLRVGPGSAGAVCVRQRQGPAEVMNRDGKTREVKGPKKPLAARVERGRPAPCLGPADRVGRVSA